MSDVRKYLSTVNVSVSKNLSVKYIVILWYIKARIFVQIANKQNFWTRIWCSQEILWKFLTSGYSLYFRTCLAAGHLAIATTILLHCRGLRFQWSQNVYSGRFQDLLQTLVIDFIEIHLGKFLSKMSSLP